MNIKRSQLVTKGYLPKIFKVTSVNPFSSLQSSELKMYMRKDECTPERWEQYKEYRRQLRLKHLEKERERDRIRKLKKRESLSTRDLARQNARHRKNYRKDPNGAAKQNARRHEREPHRAIRAAARLFQNGSIDIIEYNRRTSEIIARVEQATNETKKRI